MIFHFKDTFRLLYPVRVLVAGLVAAQAVATGVVWFSNRALSAKLAALQDAGYHLLPGMRIDPALTGFEAAFGGGVFFTLSLGAGIVLLSLGGVMLVQSVWTPQIRKALTLVLIVLWASVLVWANSNGLCYSVSAFLLILPPVTMALALWWSPCRHDRRRLPWRRAWHFFLILVLVAVWAPRIDKDLFVNIKDNLMLTTRPGMALVHLYYKYTLYPAEVFRPLSGKQVKAYAVEGVDEMRAAALEKSMAGDNYFSVSDAPRADLVIRGEKSGLVLLRNAKPVMTVSADDLLTDTGSLLHAFSDKTDNARAFRRLTLWTLVWVAPLVLYLTVFAVFSLIPGLLTGLRTASVFVPLLCCLFFVFVVIHWLDTPVVEVADRRAVAEMLQSGTRRDKIAALRYIHENGMEISRFPGFRQLSAADDYALRYWLVRNLGNSRHPDAMNRIIRWMDADSNYMVCKAIEAAAGLHGSAEKAIFRRALVDKLQTSTDWYVQHYAFRAARRAGWVPERSG
ncbi:HEAT repeat domain-containing protein [Desulfosudis oleivorans]|uniref:HEAT repeat domain-containing protein n=1 Tax=Desulfosudis oleivorans (strain DSM 6200 / JCM 39069 / Hxd3) TaxID=96561 RepID=A8ZWH2_DESOH|nr:HEAT repeat domain-containing protein [Desulfosudis oleivorans]ABW66780.1 hypothetical protein Dole_0970 [Desulfosudis oleivorans Hxd3]